ncbi:class I SAM-dependent methyltransferase [Leptothoe sp. EHU-05/26/07-4]
MSALNLKEQQDHQGQYDVLASVLNKLYQKEYSKENLEFIKTIFQQLFLQYIPEKGRILDLGCGSGQLASLLFESGYQVTGIDISEKLLSYARKNAPEVEFVQSDIRLLEYSPTFNGIFSKGALMVMMSLEGLEDVFRRVYSALLGNGVFMFDVRQEESVMSWGKSLADAHTKTLSVEDDYVWMCRSTYEPGEKVMHNFFTVFELVDSTWLRTDTDFYGKIFSTEEIKENLEKVGFKEIQVLQDGKELGSEIVTGRNLFVCRKSD